MKIQLSTLAFFTSATIFAQSPDPDFGTAGATYYEFGAFDAQFEAACIQNDNKIISVGYNGLSYNEVLVTRHTSDGVLDNTFNGTGIVQFSYGSSNEYAHTVIQLQSGKIAIGGSSFGKAVVALLNEDGSQDDTFSGDGTLSLDFGAGNGSKIEKLLQQPDGMIVGIGNAYNGSNFDFMICRFSETGELDPTFGTDGKLIIDIDGFNDFAYDADFQNSGAIVMAGYALNNAGVSQFAAIRILANGLVDESFSEAGYFILKELSIFNEIEGVAIDNEDNIIMAGRMNNDMAILKLNQNGALDNSFSGDGILNINFNGNADRAYDVVIQPDGKIIAAGWITTDFGTNDFAAARVLFNGELDATFDGDGKFTYEMGEGGSWAKEVLLTAESKILLGGQASLSFGTKANFALLQLTNEIVIDIQNLNTQGFNLYPNPCNNLVVINVPDNQIITQAQFISLDGRIINIQGSNNIFDISQLSPSTYLIKATTNNGTILNSSFVKL